ncbi:MAG TPA: flagellar hook-associated protein FlgK [Phycisphaerae bacterium]|nr:flagellar hook-associated protein FlgK [Phycisphaerae bacterium]
MGLTSALGIGRSALAAYQAALQIVGQNIANAGTPGYSRGTASLSSVAGAQTVNGQFGGGVLLEAVRRNVSEALHARLRMAMSDREDAQAQRTSLARVEDIFNPLGDTNLGTLLGEFFKSVGNVQNTPESVPARSLVVSSAQALAERIRDIHGGLLGLRNDFNAEIETAVLQADQIATKIAELNTEITVAEAASGHGTSQLRDQRDQLLGELSQIVSITVREQPTGAVNVYIGNNPLVQFGQSFGIKAVTEIDSSGLANVVVRFKLDNGPVTSSSGQIAGLIESRDTHATAQLTRLDQLASALIREVNNIHSGGKGLIGFSNITGLSAVTDPSLALSTVGNGVAFPPKTGSFFIDVKDSTTGTSTRHQINVDLDGIGGDSSLNSIAADISANVPGVTATVLADGRLQLSSAGGTTFSFADDTSNVLASLGINTLLTGTNSSDINVNSLIAAEPSLLAAAQSDFAGDGSNATALTALKDQVISSLGGVSLNEFYTTTTANIAVSVSGAQSKLDAGEVILDSLTSQRENLSGVSLDEEAINMITYQRAYEGAAQYMRVVNDMLQELLTLAR